MNQSFAHHIRALRQFGDARMVLDQHADLQRYQCGARQDIGQTPFVLRPTSTEQVSQCVAYCAANNIHLIPQSGNTGLVGGSTPDSTGAQAVLSLERMNRIWRINHHNRSAHVGAGVRLSELNAKLAEQHLFFPIDLGADPMIGGMLATNTGGAQFLKYGDVRDNTLGLTAVLADRDGTVVTLNDALRKNNTGLDLKQLFIGTSGAYGIITECVVNLAYKPQQSAAALVVPSNDDAVLPLLLALEQRLGPQLTAFEYMSSNAMRCALDHAPTLRNPFSDPTMPPLALLVAVSREWTQRGNEPSITETLENALADIWQTADAIIADALFGQPETFWALRHAISDGVRQTGYVLGFDLAFERQYAMAFRQRAQTVIAAEFPQLILCDFGHIGDGGLHFNLVHPDPLPDNLGVFEQALRERVYDLAVTEFKGSFSAEHAIGRHNQRYYDRYTPAAIKRLAAEVKHSFSPSGLSSVRFGDSADGEDRD